MTKKIKASLTVEAAIGLTAFTIAVSALLGPFLIFRSNSKILNEINNVFSKYISYTKAVEKEIDKNPEIKDKLKNISSFIDNKLIDNTVLYSAYKTFDSTVNFCIPLNNKVYDEENNMIKYNLLINYNVPFSKIIPINIYQNLISERRAFVGVKGARWLGNSEIQEATDIVYISKNSRKSKVYHENEFCTYLRHSLTNGSVQQAKNEKYEQCSYCSSKYKESYNPQNVFWTQYGSDYHYINTCPFIYAYIMQVSRDSVADMQACSRCKIGD